MPLIAGLAEIAILAACIYQVNTGVEKFPQRELLDELLGFFDGLCSQVILANGRYVAGTPGAYISHHHVSPQLYGLLFALGIVGIMVANQINSKLVRRFGINRMIRVGSVLATLAGTGAAFTAWHDWGGLWGLVTPLFFFASATGFIVANSIVGAMDIYPEQAGAVSALIGAIQYGTGIFGSACVGYFANGTPFPMALTIAGFAARSLLFSLGLRLNPDDSTPTG